MVQSNGKFSGKVSEKAFIKQGRAGEMEKEKGDSWKNRLLMKKNSLSSY
jgi:hypothetical protein